MIMDIEANLDDEYNENPMNDWTGFQEPSSMKFSY
jgi:hypothetical protein